MKVTWSTFAHNYTSAGVIANNIIIELTKLGIDVGYNALNLQELSQDDILKFPPEVQQSLKKGLREDSINIFFSYPDIYPNVRCKVNVGYSGADSSNWYQTEGAWRPSDSCNQFMDYMLTPSEYSRQIMLGCGVTIPVELFPHGVDTTLFNPIKREFSFPFTFLYTGELSKRKGTQDLIRTFKKLFKNNPKYKLVLRANSHMIYYGGNEIEELCSDCNNIEYIWKNQGQDEISTYFHTAHVYCYPSKADWYGMTVFESIASGIPTIATATNGYFEFLKDGLIHLPYKMEEIGLDHPYLKGLWSQPDLSMLETKMLAVSQEDIYKLVSSSTYNYALELCRTFTWGNVTKKYLLPFLEKLEEKHFKSENKFKKIICGYP
jgi:glycosyltransferase involved in cell wall biosynthesis